MFTCSSGNTYSRLGRVNRCLERLYHISHNLELGEDIFKRLLNGIVSERFVIEFFYYHTHIDVNKLPYKNVIMDYQDLSDFLTSTNRISLPIIEFKHISAYVSFFNKRTSDDCAYIYALKLENEKYYVGMSRNIKQRYNAHMAGNGSEWTKLHKPLGPIYVCDYSDFSEEDLTLIFMNQFGIENVRGGDWCYPILYPGTIAEIEFLISKALINHTVV